MVPIKLITCPECAGTGRLENEMCFYCEGKGEVNAYYVDPYAYDLHLKVEASTCLICGAPLNIEMERDEVMCLECLRDAALCCQLNRKETLWPAPVSR